MEDKAGYRWAAIFSDQEFREKRAAIICVPESIVLDGPKEFKKGDK